jgi:hypothetical protein
VHRAVYASAEAQRHLYEIYTAPQSDLVTAILSTEHIVELVRLRVFSENSDARQVSFAVQSTRGGS